MSPPADSTQYIDPVSDAARIDRVCLEFEDAWQSGQSPRLEDFLTTSDPVGRAALLKELMLLELEYRRRRGEQPVADEYFARFPEERLLVAELLGVPLATEGEAWATGHRVGRYRVERPIADGAFGHVYLAWDTELERMVALKTPRLAKLALTEDFDLFFEEAKTVSKIDHPAIVPVLDMIRDENGVPVMVMPYVEGPSLQDCLAQQRMPLPEVVRLLIQVAEAMDYAHRRGFVHRDLKPRNILLDREFRPHITDFGLAIHESTQHSRAGESAGSLAYMSPEQIRGESNWLDGRSDIWALGVIMYEMLSGRRPFRGQSQDELESEIYIREPKPLRQIDAEIPVELERICWTCLSKTVGGRFATARDFADSLRQASCKLGWSLDSPDEMTAPDAGQAVRNEPPAAGDTNRRIVYALVGLAAAVVLGWHGIDAALRRPATPQLPPQVDIELSVWTADDQFAGRINRATTGASPLRTGDKIRLDVSLDQPAYLYVLWIGTDGDLIPVYPWQSGHWRLTSQRAPTRAIHLPEVPDQTWQVQDGTGGVETIVVLVASQPLPQEMDLPQLILPLAPQTAIHLDCPLYFENGRLSANPAGATRSVNVAQTEPLQSPMIANQTLIAQRLGRYCMSIQALCFPFSGD